MPWSQNVPEHALATPRRSALARSALVAGGATAGLIASAIAGFGLVGLMFPNSGLPGTGGAPLTAAAYAPVPITVTVMPETVPATDPPAPVAQARLMPVPTGPGVSAPAAAAHPVPTHPSAATPAPFVPALREANRLTAPDDAPAAAAEQPAQTAADRPAPAPAVAAPATVIATKSGPAEPSVFPEVDPSTFGPRVVAFTPDPGDEIPAAAPDTSGFGPRIAALPAATEPAAGPEDFAMLADDDAAARAGAGLFAATGKPDTATGAATAPDGAATSAAMRPARRPEGGDETVVAAAAMPDPGTAPLRSIRPAPRPEVRLVAAPAPAPAATLAGTPAAPQTAGFAEAPAAVVEVAAKSGSGGFFAGGTSGCGKSLARSMPTRKGGATGSAFFAGLANVWGPDRDARAIAELARGNMPGFLRNLQPVTFRGRDGRGQAVEITICVTPDYLALGSDQDYVRVPLGLPAAARIAGAFDMTLPTPRMVDAIYAQANVKLSPAPMTPGAQMQSTGYFLTHNATIEKQLQGRRGLIGGHKKDVVMASRMASAPGRVAIYGWHQSNGAPIQPVSTVHGATYADYSHGIRLVSKTAFLNGKPVALDDLLSSSRYAALLNDDGPMPGPVIRVASN